MKHRILLVTAFLLVSVFALNLTVSPVATAQDQLQLTFWNYWDGNNGEAVQALIDRYNEAHPAVHIQNTFIGWGELLPKLQIAVAGGDTPDMAAADMAWMPLLARSGNLVPLSDMIAAAPEPMDDFYPALMAVNIYDGVQYGLPVSTNNLELFINTDLFEAAGLAPASLPTTWDELKDAAVTCANPEEGIVGMELFTQPGEGLTWQFQVYLWQAGGDFLTDDLSAAAFNSDAGIAALEYWLDLIDSGAYALSSWGLFGQGQACMVMDGTWMVGIWADTAPFEWTTAPMPYPADGEPATNMGGEHMFIMTDDEAKQQAAWEFMVWFTSPEIQKEWDMLTGFMPVRDAVASDEAYQAWIEETEPRLQPFVSMQQYAHNRPPVEVYPELSDVFSGMLEQALYGQMSAQEALAAAEVAVNALLR